MRAMLREESNSVSSFSVLLDDDSRSVPWKFTFHTLFAGLHLNVSFLLAAYPFRLKILQSRCQTLRRRQLMTCYLLSVRTRALPLYCSRECVSALLGLKRASQFVRDCKLENSLFLGFSSDCFVKTIVFPLLVLPCHSVSGYYTT